MSAFQQPPNWKDMARDAHDDNPEDGRLMSERIASEIRSAVLSGEMRPGMRIRQELLAAHFGASRIPVREALKQLENEGLVVMAPNRGAWIADVNSEESIEIYKIREAVEPLAIGESVPHLSDDDIEALERIVHELEHIDVFEEYIQLDREFHLRTYAGARMPQLLAMVERFWNSTQHFRRRFLEDVYARQGLPFSDPQHLLLMDAIRKRDVEAAQVLIRLHIRRTRLLIEATASNASQPPVANRVPVSHARGQPAYGRKTRKQ
jgi:DNA-binding GntR family transcriptional regulator